MSKSYLSVKPPWCSWPASWMMTFSIRKMPQCLLLFSTHTTFIYTIQGPFCIHSAGCGVCLDNYKHQIAFLPHSYSVFFGSFFFLILAVRGNFINKWSCGIPSTIEWRDCQYVALNEVKMSLILEISSSETYILNLSSLLFPLLIMVFSPSYSPSCFSHLSLLTWKFWLFVGGKQ